MLSISPRTWTLADSAIRTFKALTALSIVKIRKGGTSFLLEKTTNNKLDGHTWKVKTDNQIAPVTILKHQQDMNGAQIHRIPLKKKGPTTDHGGPDTTRPHQDGYRGAHRF